MGLLLQAIYSNLFRYFCLPIFALMIFGKPRFLIRIAHKLINIEEPVRHIRIFRFFIFICAIYVVFCYYRSYQLTKLVYELSNTSELQRQAGVGNINFLDEKVRESYLFERNCYFFFTFMIILLTVEKFCHNYFKLWAKEDEVRMLKTGERRGEILLPTPDVTEKKDEMFHDKEDNRKEGESKRTQGTMVDTEVQSERNEIEDEDMIKKQPLLERINEAIDHHSTKKEQNKIINQDRYENIYNEKQPT